MPTFPQLSDEAMRRMLEPASAPMRLIIDTDTHNEIDDQFTIAWALMSQDKLEIEGVCAEPYSFRHHREPMIAAYDQLKLNPQAMLSGEMAAMRRFALNHLQAGTDPRTLRFVDPDEGMELSYQEIIKVFDLMDAPSAGKVFRGSPGYLTSLDAPIRSDAAKFIVERALAQDERPLYIAAIGCLTNIASALLMAPEIASRIVVLWTSTYPSFVNLNHAPSLNLVQDVLASKLIYDCGVPLVFLPGYYIGEQLKLSLADVETYVRGKGKIGDYLYHLYTHNPVHTLFGINDHYARTWVIWDLIDIAWLLQPEWVPSQLVRAPHLTDDLYWAAERNPHLMREAYGLDRDAIFRDFFRKLEGTP
ncbi:MAG: nucleoside hydrolase [Anaerolineae bacterium]|nr:nucleoside hydrolase [Anaerolineae bacterium]